MTTPMPPATASRYTARELPQADWDRVRGLPPFQELGGLPDPAGATIVVVEDGGRIVASWFAVPFTHLEGVWIDPLARRSKVSALLLTEMKATLQKYGVQVAFTIALTDQVKEVAEHAGFEVVPGTLMGLRIQEP